jgi:hypothetical protein
MTYQYYMTQQTQVDTNGDPYAGGLLYFYETGTTTLLDTYSDEILSSANANPVVADSAGRFAAIFLKPQAYKVVFKTSADVTVWTQDPVNGAVKFADKGADIASAATLVLGKDGSYFDVTGTATITAITGHGAGTEFRLHFDDALSITYNATSMILPGSVDLKTAAGDELQMIEYSAGNFRVISHMPADGKASVRTERNGLHNGGFCVAQRGTSFTAATTPVNSDDTYLLDRWLLLSDGNDVADVSQELTVVPTGSYAACKSLVATANKKWGFVQFLEAKDASRFIGGTASLSFKARTTTGAVINNIRAAIISWDSTADAVTSDIVSAWGSQGTDPTLVSNWTYENTPANIAVTADAYATHRIESVSVDTASAANIAVFIWVDDTDAAANDVLYITDVQLDVGTRASAFERRSYADDLSSCQRYYEQSYDVGTAPGTSTENGAVQMTDPVAAGETSVRYSTTKRTAPTLTGYSTTGASGKYRDLTSGADFNITFSDGGMSGCHVVFSTSGAADELKGFHWTADAEL